MNHLQQNSYGPSKTQAQIKVRDEFSENEHKTIRLDFRVTGGAIPLVTGLSLSFSGTKWKMSPS